MFSFQNELLETLDSLIVHWENEVVEFKEANRDYDKDKTGQYFSAISNEANLKGLQYGWLVFGVRNKVRNLLKALRVENRIAMDSDNKRTGNWVLTHK